MGQILSEQAHFAQRVREEMARSRRGGVTFAIAIFTSRPGDSEMPDVACVRALPALLADIRETDTVCRIGDDRIAVLLIDAEGEASLAAAERLTGDLAGHASSWDTAVLQYPGRDDLLDEVGIAA